MALINFLKPAPHKALVAEPAVDAEYKRRRLQVFLGIFIGYAGYYLVRKNFSLVIPDLIERGFSKGELGLALSAGLTGLFGYLGGALFTNIAMGYVVDAWGWDGGFGVLIAACLLSIFFVALTWNKEKTFLNLS